ncbi:MAG TPA: enoyl-CoA hydratase-related protein [Halioglobus sp.]
MAVETIIQGRILVIKMARPEKRNALNADITLGIDAAMNELEDNAELWCGILTGSETAFSAGADLATGPGEPTERGGIVGLINRHRTKPLIAAVEGMALGGGLELVLCCDLVIASTSAKFGLPEVKRGLMPDFGGAFRISRYLPTNIARELLLSGENISAERAERLGFVNYLTEDGQALARATALAEKICDNAPLAVRAGLAIFNAEVNGNEAESWDRSHAAHMRLLKTEDVKEGIGAFFEKRQPVWSGK